MSTRELEHPEEQRPRFTGLTLGDLKPGMAALKPGTVLYCKALYWRGKRLLKRIVFLSESKVDCTVVLKGTYIGSNIHEVYKSGVMLHGMHRYYSQEPSCYYCVLNGLEIPDELKYEVVLFLPDLW